MSPKQYAQYQLHPKNVKKLPVFVMNVCKIYKYNP